MNLFRVSASALVVCSCVILQGCNRNPALAKQKYLEKGARYLQKGDFPAAAIEFSNAVQADPRSAAAHLDLGEVYLKMQRFPEAYRELQHTVELDPRNDKALLDLGYLYIAGKAYDRAGQMAAEMLRQDPASPDAHSLLSAMNQSQGKFNAAFKEINLAIAGDPNVPEYYVQRATLQASTARRQDAEASLRRALDIDPGFVPALQALSVLDVSTGQLPDAQSHLRQLIELQPHSIEPREELALVYSSEHRQAQAEQLMVQAKRDFSQDGDDYRVLGEYYERIGDTNKALAEFASISQAHPKDLRTREDYIGLLLLHGHFPEADKLSEALLSDNPNDSGVQIIRGTVLNALSEGDQAVEILERAVSGAPENPQAYYQLGIALRQSGQSDRAEQALQRASDLAPRRTDIQVALEHLALAEDNQQILTQAAKRIAEDDATSPRDYLLRAQAEEVLRDMTAAQKDIEQALAAAPGNADVYLAMGNLLRMQGRNGEARENYEKALQCDPGNVKPLAAIADILHLKRKDSQALKRVRLQATKVPGSDELYLLLGRLELASNHMTAAQAALERATQLNPGNMAAFALLSNVEVAEHRDGDALVTAYKSIEMNPHNAAAYYLAASLEAKAGYPFKAEEIYRKALQIDPDYAPAANNLSSILLQQGGDTDEALSLAQFARERIPDSPNTADTLAWAYYQKGNYARAEVLLQEALDQAPDNAIYQYHIGMVLWKQNMTTAALQHLQRAAKIDPGSPAASEIRIVVSRPSMRSGPVPR